MKGNVKRKLFNSFCMAVYGSQLWDYSSTNVPEAFYTAWRKCLWRIDGLPNKTHKIILPVLWDVFRTCISRIRNTEMSSLGLYLG